ncbi:MAG: hypothetical protein AAF766_18615, partial [Cyanobacteria bacterium P01_D01_bin.14]
DSSWLSSVVNKMKSDDIDYMGCRVEIQNKGSTDTLAALHNQIMGFPIKRSIDKAHYVPTCCLVTKAALFEKLGQFDPMLISGGDVEFGNRVFQTGIELHYAPEVIVYHPARSTLISLGKKYLRVGRGVCQIAQRYPIAELYPTRVPHYRRSFIRRILPPKPSSFFQKLNSQLEEREIVISWLQAFLLYFIDWYAKWAMAAGYIIERVSGNFEKAEVHRNACDS